MLRALLERGIRPDVVIGTSAGALNGAAVAYAPNLTGVAQLAAVWEQLQADHVFPGGRIHRAWNIVRRGTHLFGNEGLAALIHHSTPARSFSDLEIPLRVIATDRRRVTFEIAAQDELDAISTGTHTRFVVDVETTRARLKAKAAKQAALRG